MKKLFFKYVLQNVAGMIGVSVYILADTFFISLYSGADGLTMLNLVIPIYGLMYAFGSMVGIGSAIRYALKKASGDENTDFYFTHALSWDLILSIPFILLGIFAPQWVLHLMGADARITELGIQYLRIILIGSPFFMMNYAFTAFARNDNATTIAMIGSLSGSAFNIVFDYIFMFPLNMGMAGAALATALSPIVTMSVCSIHYLGKKNTIGFRWRLPSPRHLFSCCKLGVSAFIGEIASAVTTTVFNILILAMAGNIGVAAYGVIANISIVALSIPIKMNPTLISKVTVSIIRHFVFFVIPFPAAKSARLSLYNFVFLNQLSSLFEDLAKQKAASNKKGTVGNTGNTAPTAPSPALIHPKRIYIIFSSANLRLISLFFHLSAHSPMFHRIHSIGDPHGRSSMRYQYH